VGGCTQWSCAVAVPTPDLIQLGTQFAMDTLVRAGEHVIFNDFCLQLRRLYATNIPACRWFLADMAAKGPFLSEVIFTARDTTLRKPFVDLCSDVLRIVSGVPEERALFLREHREQAPHQPFDADGQPGTVVVPDSPAVQFIHTIVGLHTEVCDTFKRFCFIRLDAKFSCPVLCDSAPRTGCASVNTSSCCSSGRSSDRSNDKC